MYYEVTTNGELYYTNISTKKACLAIVKLQFEAGKNVMAYRVYPETDHKPEHREVISFKKHWLPQIERAKQ